MSEIEFQAVDPLAIQTPGLTQAQRVTYTFTAPSKTFADIRRGNKSWWLPFLIMILVSYVFFAVATLRIGWDQVAQNAIHLNPKSEEKLAQAPEASRAMALKITRYSIEGGFLASPVIILVILAVGALVLLGTINFIFGGKAKYGSVFAMYMYASLPSIVKTLLAVIVIFAGEAPESFNIKNPAPTNLGAFLDPIETNKALYSLASSIDAVTIWTLVLLSIGLATVAGVKRSSGYMAVFGWWVLIVLLGAGWAAAFG